MIINIKVFSKMKEKEKKKVFRTRIEDLNDE